MEVLKLNARKQDGIYIRVQGVLSTINLDQPNFGNFLDKLKCLTTLSNSKVLIEAEVTFVLAVLKMYFLCIYCCFYADSPNAVQLV